MIDLDAVKKSILTDVDIELAAELIRDGEIQLAKDVVGVLFWARSDEELLPGQAEFIELVMKYCAANGL